MTLDTELKTIFILHDVRSTNEYLSNFMHIIPDSDTDDHAASRRNSVNLDIMQSALIAHSGPPSVAASSVHGGDSAAVATAAAASEVDLIQSAVDLVSQG